MLRRMLMTIAVAGVLGGCSSMPCACKNKKKMDSRKMSSIEGKKVCSPDGKSNCKAKKKRSCKNKNKN